MRDPYENKWYWYEDRRCRPTNSGKYLVYKASNEFEVLNFSVMHQAWNLHDRADADKSKELKVLYWTELPNTKDLLKDVV